MRGKYEIYIKMINLMIVIPTINCNTITKNIIITSGPHFAPMEILNCLAQERGYKIIYPPQQHGIPLKPGAMDDK